jgi:hypothetical protein
MEAAMRSCLLLGLCVAGLAYLSEAAAATAINTADARQKVLAVARQRLSLSADKNGSDASLRLDHADKTGFFFAAHATHPCLSGQDVCSSLIGHFRVDRQSGAVFDEDVQPERPVS